MLTLRLFVVAFAAAALAGCHRPSTLLTQLVEARRLAADVHVQFTRAAEASNRAVLAATEDAAEAAAGEARQARLDAEQAAAALRPLLASIGDRDDLINLDAFTARFGDYRRLDDEVLTLAVANTNVKAQRLAFGPAAEAAAAFHASVDAALAQGSAANGCAAAAIAARARAAVLQIQVLEAPHIAEADDAAMLELERRMQAAASIAAKALEDLKAALRPPAHPRLDAAGAALQRFLSVHAEIVRLSRRNSNVRSVALSLGRKRTLTAACEAQLQAIETALSRHAFTATR